MNSYIELVYVGSSKHKYLLTIKQYVLINISLIQYSKVINAPNYSLLFAIFLLHSPYFISILTIFSPIAAYIIYTISQFFLPLTYCSPSLAYFLYDL
ncbi:hypothetical protein FKM82_019999 [Ascaphus truei]